MKKLKKNKADAGRSCDPDFQRLYDAVLKAIPGRKPSRPARKKDNIGYTPIPYTPWTPW